MAPRLSPLRLLQLGKKGYEGELYGTALAEGAKKYDSISSLKKFGFKRGRNAISQFYWTIESKAIRGIFLFVHVSIHETIGKGYTHKFKYFLFCEEDATLIFPSLCPRRRSSSPPRRSRRRMRRRRRGTPRWRRSGRGGGAGRGRRQGRKSSSSSWGKSSFSSGKK